MSNPTDAFVAAVQALAEAVRASASDPADQTRLLQAMAGYAPAGSAGLAPIGVAIATMRTAVSAVCRRAALGSLARACAAYQLTSYQDALTLRTAVAALLDGEILVAADAGDTQSYLALRALRTAVVLDLTTRGSQLPALTEIQVGTSLPSLVLAWSLYQDATRSEELLAGAGQDVPHPAFMPTGFTALIS